MMNDSEFLRHLQATDKIEYYLFGSSPLWKIKGTCLSLQEKDKLVTKEFPGGGGCCYGESSWYVLTTSFFIVLKMSEFGTPLEEYWNSLDFEKLEQEGIKQNEWFRDLPDF